MGTKTRRAITPGEVADWSQRAQFFALEGIGDAAAWGVEELAFHGGTNLHLSWSSPRRSEDLDFLLADHEGAKLDTVVRLAHRRVAERFVALDPAFRVELRDKSNHGGRMAHFQLVIAKEGVVGQAMVKLEFWKVTAEYLSRYRSEFRQPIPPQDVVSHMTAWLPAATLAMAYCDKMVAFATRDFVKWRDFFDAWWIRTQGRQDPQADPAFTSHFLHNLSAYNTVDNLPPAAALRRYLDMDETALLAKAASDLRPWLPEQIWKSLEGRGVKQILDLVRSDISRLADSLDMRDSDTPEDSVTAEEDTQRGRFRG